MAFRTCKSQQARSLGAWQHVQDIVCYLKVPTLFFKDSKSFWDKNTLLYVCISAGEVPDWLSGTLYRVGPGVIQSGDTLYEHLFDMPSVLHKYTLKPGVQRFTYQNRIVTLTAEDMAEGVNSQPPFGSKVRKYVFIEFLQNFRRTKHWCLKQYPCHKSPLTKLTQVKKLTYFCQLHGGQI